MVSRKTNERKAVRIDGIKTASEPERPRKKFPWSVIGLTFATTLVMVVFLWMIGTSLVIKHEDSVELVGECPALGGEVVNNRECLDDGAVKKMDFQDTVDNWVNSVGGKKGVIIYDLMRGEVAGEYDADEKFATASLYKLFVVYAGYMKVVNGEWGMDDVVNGTAYNVGQCLDLAIRESHSECAEALWGMIGRDALDKIVQDEWDLPNVEVGSLMATPREIMQIMLKFYQREDFTENIALKMLDSFLNQPITTYNWRQGLPSGFSDTVNVYNKVGWEYSPDVHGWLIYDDAAVVDFPDADRTFVIVVMTNGVDFNDVARFAGDFERRFRQQL